MRIALNRTVGEIAAADPKAARVFESKRIDCCCGGKRTLEPARHPNYLVSVDLILELRGVVGNSPDRPVCWTDARRVKRQPNVST